MMKVIHNVGPVFFISATATMQSAYRIILFLAMLLGLVQATAHAQLLFKGRDYVEIQKSRGMLDLNKDFTLEFRVKFDDTHLDEMSIAGDEAWASLLNVSSTCGWVFRTGKLTDGNKRHLEFSVAGSSQGPADWFTVQSKHTEPTEYKSAEWQHLTVVKHAKYITLFWNGARVARKLCTVRQLHAAPTELYLGLRKGGLDGRSLHAQIHSFRVSDRALAGVRIPIEDPFPVDEHTLVAYDFSREKEGKIIHDQSPHGRDGLIEGPIYVSGKE